MRPPIVQIGDVPYRRGGLVVGPANGGNYATHIMAADGDLLSLASGQVDAVGPAGSELGVQSVGKRGDQVDETGTTPLGKSGDARP